MNKIIREHYPVSRLPDDLRQGLDPTGDAIVTVEQSMVPTKRVRFSDFEHLRVSHFASPEEVVAHVRSLRDDDR